MKTGTNGCDGILTQARELLDQGKPAEAREVLLRFGSQSPALRDALGVCLMRMGATDKAVDLYRSLVLYRDSVCFRPEATSAAKANYATALLLSGNVAGCEAALNEIDDAGAPGVVKLREAILKWKRSLSAFRRVLVALNGPPYDARVTLDFPPGEIGRPATDTV